MGSKITKKMDAQSLYQDIMDYIFAATELVKRGDYIELAGLDDHVTKMCNIINNMSVEDSLSMRDDLTKMMTQLDELHQLFVDARERVGQEINGLGKHKQASIAYKQSERASIHMGAKDLRPDEDEHE